MRNSHGDGYITPFEYCVLNEEMLPKIKEILDAIYPGAEIYNGHIKDVVQLTEEKRFVVSFRIDNLKALIRGAYFDKWLEYKICVEDITIIEDDVKCYYQPYEVAELEKVRWKKWDKYDLDLGNECKEAIRQGKLSDFMTIEGKNFCEEDLIAIIKELDYAISKSDESKNEIYKAVADGLFQERRRK